MLKSNYFYFIGLTFIFILVYPYIFDEKIFLGGDNAEYYSLAQGIVNNWSYAPSYAPIQVPANHFPPGYPFILAILIKIGVTSFSGLKIANGLFLLGSVLITYLLCLRFTSKHIFSGLIALCILLNMHMLDYSTIVMSEIPFVFVSLFSFYCFTKFIDSGFKLKSFAFILTVIGCIAAVYIRTQGITIVGGFVFYLIIVKNYKISAILLVLVVIGILPWQIRSNALGGSSYVKQLTSVDPYADKSEKMQMKDWMHRIKENAGRYASKELTSLAFPNKPTTYNDAKTGKPVPATSEQWIIGISIVLLGLFGIWKLKEFRWLLLSFFGANFLILLLWPEVWFGIRFVLPLTPLIFMAVFLGVKSLLELKIKHAFVTEGKFFPILIIPFILINFQGVKKLHLKAEGKHQANWANYLLMAEWIEANVPGEKVIVTRKPGLFYAKSHKKVMNFIFTDDVEKIFQDFDNQKATHIVLEQLGFRQTGKYLYPLLVKEPDRFKLIHSIGARDAKDANGNKTKTPDGVWLYEYNPKLGYKGKYKNGLKSGKGTYYYANESIMEGTWVNDTLNGPGKLLQKDGQAYYGSWKKGKRDGDFLIITKDNRRIQCTWKEDKVLPQGYLVDKSGRKLGPIKLN